MANKKANCHDIANMSFAMIYPLYLNKVEKKGRTKAELHQIITWLTGYDDQDIQDMVAKETTFGTLFDGATLNPNADQIKGVVCGHRVEEIKDPLTQKLRYLDKLIDELARGRKMDKILRSSQGA